MAEAKKNRSVPTLDWLIAADAAALDSDIDGAAEGLRTAGGDHPADILLAAAVNVAGRCVESTSETDALAPKRARPLVLAAVVVIAKQLDGTPALRERAGVTETLRRLASRKDDFGNPAITKKIAQLVADHGPTDPEPTATLGEVPAAVSESPERGQSPLEEWLSRRDEVREAADRATRDVTFLLALAGSPLPADYAEALYGDRDIWIEPVIAGWLETLDAPLDGAVSGVAAAALLNARIREVRPRLFLRSPTSLVVQPIASSAELDQLRDEVRQDIVGRVLRTVWDSRWVLEAERKRKEGVRRLEVEKVAETLGGLFSRLGYDERPAIDSAVQYDPTVHVAAGADLANQEKVLIRRPGLWDRATGALVIQPVVARPEPEPEPEPETQPDPAPGSGLGPGSDPGSIEKRTGDIE